MTTITKDQAEAMLIRGQMPPGTETAQLVLCLVPLAKGEHLISIRARVHEIRPEHQKIHEHIATRLVAIGNQMAAQAYGRDPGDMLVFDRDLNVVGMMSFDDPSTPKGT